MYFDRRVVAILTYDFQRTVLVCSYCYVPVVAHSESMSERDDGSIHAIDIPLLYANIQVLVPGYILLLLFNPALHVLQAMK